MEIHVMHLRNAILHSGSSIIEFENPKDKIKANIYGIELCANSNSDIDNQYEESVSIITDCCDERIITIRINIINFVLTMIKGYKDFLNECNINDIPLFLIIDLDNKKTIITFISDK